jgi:hypothetical protein
LKVFALTDSSQSLGMSSLVFSTTKSLFALKGIQFIHGNGGEG